MTYQRDPGLPFQKLDEETIVVDPRTREVHLLNDTAARYLDDEWGVMARAGLHCAPAAHRALGTAPEGTLRLSWGEETTEQEIDVTVEALRTIAARGRSAAPARSVA